MNKTIINFIDKIKENGHPRRLYKIFKTRKNFYLYDVRTGKIFEISDSEAIVLDDLFDNGILTQKSLNLINKNELIDIFNDFIHHYEKESIFQAPILNKFIGPQFDNLEATLKNAKTQINLELTEQCNLRCTYCLYHEGQGGYRRFGENEMSKDIAFKALQEFNQTNSKEVYVSFYGGEPLLKFNLMKRCIDYAEKNFPDKEIFYSFTTNAVLINDDMISYFDKYKEKFG